MHRSKGMGWGTGVGVGVRNLTIVLPRSLGGGQFVTVSSFASLNESSHN